MEQREFEMGDVGFGDPPESVQRNVAEMKQIATRRAGNEAVISKRDTERYLVVVYASRTAREQALKDLGLPEDERYLAGDAITLALKDGARLRNALVLAGRACKAAEPDKSGSAG